VVPPIETHWIMAIQRQMDTNAAIDITDAHIEVDKNYLITVLVAIF